MLAKKLYENPILLCNESVWKPESVMSDTVILHKAAGIIQSALGAIRKESKDSFSGMDIDLVSCRQFIPDVLFDFITWCTNKEAFKDAVSKESVCVNRTDLPVIAICQNIIGLNSGIRTPLTLGLGIQMHHDFASRKLIDILHSFGHSVSYEVQRFLTSVTAAQVSETEKLIVPRGLTPADPADHKTMIHAAIDNFD